MLKRMGNPFVLTIDDSHGELGLKLGVDGAPETYLVDVLPYNNHTNCPTHLIKMAV